VDKSNDNSMGLGGGRINSRKGAYACERNFGNSKVDMKIIVANILKKLNNSQLRNGVFMTSYLVNGSIYHLFCLTC